MWMVLSMEMAVLEPESYSTITRPTRTLAQPYNAHHFHESLHSARADAQPAYQLLRAG